MHDKPRTIYLVWGASLLFLVVAASTLAFAYGAIFWIGALGFPFALDYGEGGVLGGVVDILAGRPLYSPFEGPPYTLQNYPPVFMAGVAGFSFLSGVPPLEVGRLASIASAIFCAFACGAMTWRFSGQGTTRTVRGVSAFAACVIFLGAAPVILWSPLMRVDLVALAFSLAGLWAFAASRYRPAWIASACALFVLAAFTRPTTVSALVACCGVALLTRPKVGLAMVAGCASAAVVGVLALDGMTGDEFSKHVIWANASAAWEWRRALKNIQEFVFRAPATILVASGAAFWIMSLSAREAMAALPSMLRLRPSSDSPQFSTLAAAYFGVSAALVFMGGRNGAYINYTLEVISATAIMAGVAIPYLWRFVSSFRIGTTGTKFRPLAAIAGAVLSLAVIAQMYSAKRDIGYYRNSLIRLSSGGDSFAETRRIIEEIERAPGDVLTEDRMLAVLASKRIYFEFHDGSLLLDAGVIDPAPLLRSIEAREFPLIVVEHRTHQEIADEQLGRNSGRLSRVLQRGIARNYFADPSYARLAVYRPAPNFSDPNTEFQH